jgi:tetratricopeptide (TPR) repeat protein
MCSKEIHELLRGYALERLQTSPGAWKAVRDRHSEYYVTFLYERGEEMKGSGQKVAFDAVEAEIENVRGGWLWAVDQGRFDIIDKTLDGLYSFYTTRALSQEVNGLLEKAVAAAEKPASGPEDRLLYARLLILHCLFYAPHFLQAIPERAKLTRRALALIREKGSERHMGLAYSLLTYVYGWVIERKYGIQLLRDGVVYLRDSGEKWALSVSLTLLGELLNSVGARVEAKQLLVESAAISRQIGDRLHLARNLVALAAIASEEQAYDEAISLCKESREIFDSIGDRGSAAITLSTSGVISLRAGEYKKASHFYGRSREIFTDIGNRNRAAIAMSFEGLTACRMGDLERAREIRQECLTLFQELADENGIAWSLWEMGDIYRIRGDYEEARLWYRDSLRHYQAQNFPLWLDYRAKGDIALALGEDAEARDYYKEYLSRAREHYRFGNVSYALSGLGRAAVGLGDYEMAHRHFIDALHTARDEGERGLMLIALAGMAGWLAATGENKWAVELAAFVSEHHASWYETKNQATRVMEDASARLPAEVAELAQEKGKSRELGELIAEFLIV